MIGAWTGLVLGLLGRFYWAFDLCSHFYVQFTVIALVGTISWIGAVDKRILAIALVAWLMLLPSIAWFYIGRNSDIETRSRAVRVVSCNVLTSNPNKSAVLDFLRQSDADIVLLMEVDDEWSQVIKTLDQLYPHQLHQARDDNFGIVLISKLPWKSAVPIQLDNSGIPSIEAIFENNAKQLRFVGTHPLPPTGREYSMQRNLHFVNLAKRLRESGTALPTIVIGDLNCTSWSHHFRKLLNDSQLRDSRQGFGVQRSWPTSMKLSILGAIRIPIDHALVSSDVRVHDRIVGPFVGSDHFPIVVDIGF